MAHTPGPWYHKVTTVRRGKVISEDVERFAVVAANGETVCGGRSMLRDDDAALIAVAPDLLELVRLVVANARPVGDLEQSSLSYNDLKRFRAMLAKVDGL